MSIVDNDLYLICVKYNTIPSVVMVQLKISSWLISDRELNLLYIVEDCCCSGLLLNVFVIIFLVKLTNINY